MAPKICSLLISWKKSVILLGFREVVIITSNKLAKDQMLFSK